MKKISVLFMLFSVCFALDSFCPRKENKFERQQREQREAKEAETKRKDAEAKAERLRRRRAKKAASKTKGGSSSSSTDSGSGEDSSASQKKGGKFGGGRVAQLQAKMKAEADAKAAQPAEKEKVKKVALIDEDGLNLVEAVCQGWPGSIYANMLEKVKSVYRVEKKLPKGKEKYAILEPTDLMVFGGNIRKILEGIKGRDFDDSALKGIVDGEVAKVFPNGFSESFNLALAEDANGRSSVIGVANIAAKIIFLRMCTSEEQRIRAKKGDDRELSVQQQAKVNDQLGLFGGTKEAQAIAMAMFQPIQGDFDSIKCAADNRWPARKCRACVNGYNPRRNMWYVGYAPFSFSFKYGWSPRGYHQAGYQGQILKPFSTYDGLLASLADVGVKVGDRDVIKIKNASQDFHNVVNKENAWDWGDMFIGTRSCYYSGRVTGAVVPGHEYCVDAQGDPFYVDHYKPGGYVDITDSYRKSYWETGSDIATIVTVEKGAAVGDVDRKERKHGDDSGVSAAGKKAKKGGRKKAQVLGGGDSSALSALFGGRPTTKPAVAVAKNVDRGQAVTPSTAVGRQPLAPVQQPKAEGSIVPALVKPASVTKLPAPTSTAASSNSQVDQLLRLLKSIG